MKVTKGIIGEEVRRILAGGDIPADFPIEDLDINILVTQVAADLFAKGMKEQIRESGSKHVPGNFLKSYKETIVSTGHEDSVTLPVPVVALPDDLGVYVVKPCGRNCENMVRVDPDYCTIFAGLIGGPTKGVYYLQGDKIIFPELPDGVKEVEMLLLSADFTNDDDPLIVPSDYQAEMINIVMNLAGQMVDRPQDVVNDGSKP